MRSALSVKHPAQKNIRHSIANPEYGISDDCGEVYYSS
jgi:hypothetical protein